MLDITSSANSTIKKIKSLYRRRDRWSNRSFIVEGIKTVEECVDEGYPISCIVISQDLYDTHKIKGLVKKISNSKELIRVPDKLFKEISDTESPQGILAVADFREDSIEELYRLANPFIMLLDRLQDPGNMGTIIRAADAFNVDGIITTHGCVDIYNPKVVRATMGSIFRVPIYHQTDGIKVIGEFKRRDMKIYSTSVEGDSYIHEIDFNLPSMVIIGNESKGVSGAIELLADDLIRIPMSGGAESLNAAMASTIIMYEYTRQRCQ